MDLNINDERTLSTRDGSLTETTLLAALAALQVEEFAVLAEADQRYVQTFRETQHGFALEYREGSSATHFGAPAPVSRDSVEAAFLAYLGGDFDAWRSAIEWERVNLDA